MSDTPELLHPSGDKLPQLTERQEYILSLIVREYIRTGQPVGSKALVERFDLGFSSATVRNEMGVLEAHSLIYAPHTSAGRVPTQKGYRYFVQRLLTAAGLPAQEREQIAREFRRAARNVDEWPRVAAMTLARVVRTAALVTPPRPSENRFKHLELINTQGRLVLMVLVVQGGSVHQQVLTLAEAVPQERLSRTAALINASCAGMTAEEIRAKVRTHPDELTRDIAELVAEALGQANQQAARDVVRYGLSQSLAAFTEDEAQQIVRVLEEDALLDAILQDMLAPDQPDLQIVVAGEGRWEPLHNLSMVLGRYGTSQARGAVGVLGPTRMRYGRAVSAVRYVASLMSDMLNDVYSEPKD